MGKKGTAYKVADARDQDRRFGIVASTVGELLEKACAKLKVGSRGARLFEADGTAIEDDDYLLSLPARTTLIVAPRGVQWTPDSGKAVDNLVAIMESLLAARDGGDIADITDQIDACRSRSEELASSLESFLGVVQSNSDRTKREEDPEWFVGVQPRFKTKEEQMRYTARTRVHGYLVTARDFVKVQKGLSSIVEDILQKTLKQFEIQLKKDSYFEDYFDRRADDGYRLCKQTGWFSCQGKYYESSCSKIHSIDPYAHKAARLTFTTWNLDHVIEKSREVLPSLVQAAKDSAKRQKVLNWEYFYRCLFTLDNLKLVHISCHMKDQHVGYECDPRKFLL